jgi:hypothetical protein
MTANERQRAPSRTQLVGLFLALTALTILALARTL